MAEAEYIAACVATQELVWMKRLVRELLFIRKIPCILYVDNKSAIDLMNNLVFNRRTKHIDVTYHYFRDMYLKGKFVVEQVSTDEQQAYILTKPLPKDSFEYFRELLRVCKRSDINVACSSRNR